MAEAKRVAIAAGLPGRTSNHVAQRRGQLLVATDFRLCFIGGGSLSTKTIVKRKPAIACLEGGVLCCLLLLMGLGSNLLRADVVFADGAQWNFFIGTQEASSPQSAWRFAGFDDSSWTAGYAPIGYGEPDIVTTIPSSSAGGYLSVFLRKTFTVANPGEVTQLSLDIRIDDGYVAWINGVEVGRYNVPAGALAFNAKAASTIEPTAAFITISTNLTSLLVAGTNVVAIQVFNSTTTSTDLLFDAALSLVVDGTAPTMTTVSPPAFATVMELSQIEVVFDESVVGVDAGDLLINGSRIATNVTAYSPADYVFKFPTPSTGLVSVAWASNHGITDTATIPHAFAGGSWSYTLDPGAVTSLPIISEFMADNANGITDEDGSHSDWIEIYNPGPLAVNLNGWLLTDTATNLAKWRFPSVTMDVGEYMVVWASQKDRTNPAAPLHTNFKLDKSGEFLALSDPHTNIVSSFSPLFPAQSADVSYGRDRVDPNIVGYFDSPTPGAANSTTGSGFAPAPVFSLESGVYTNSSLLLVLSAPSGTIRYTTNGTVPTTTSPAYTTPISITRGTVIKARVFQTGLFPGPVVAKAYHFLDSTTRDFSSNLPLVIIDTSGRAIAEDVPPGQPRTPGSVCVINTVRGRASLRMTPEYNGPAEVEIVGQTSSNFPKKPFSVEIQDAYGADHAVSLLDMPAEADWKLRNPYSDKCLMNDFLGYELHEKMGHYVTRRRFVEVFVDTNGGKLTYPGDYYGILVLLEKIEVDKNRVNLAELTPSCTNEPSISGGYIFKKDKDSTGDLNFTTVGGSGFSAQALKIHAPKPAKITSTQLSWLTNHLDQMERSLYSSSWLTATGTNHYAYYLDADSLVDNHWIVEFTKQIDGYRLSAYFSKDRNGKVKMEPIWDWNLSFGNANYNNGWLTDGWYYAVCTEAQHIWLRRLMCGTTSATGTSGDPDFNQRIVDRWSQLRTNVLNGTNVNARIDEIATLLNEAQARDFAKFPRLGSNIWPNPAMYITPTNYSGIITNMKAWVLGRYLWIDSQFLKAPSFNLPGGIVSPGFNLVMSAPAGTIYYTLDGTDPRRPGGSVSPTALAYSGAVVLNSNACVFARARSGTSWSGPNSATFMTQTPPLVISEIMYHPAPPPTGSTNTDDDFEYLELKNVGSAPLNLNGFTISGGVDFTFGNLTLAAGQNVVVVNNAAAFTQRYGTGPLIADEFTGNLDNGGERLVLKGRYGETILDFHYDDEWYPITDGFGFSLVIVDENGPLDTWGDKARWRPSGTLDGTPGTTNTVASGFPRIVVNEALTHTDLPQVDTVELLNLGTTNANVGGWFLTDDFRTPKKFRIPDNTVISAGACLTYNTNDFGSGTNIGFAFSALGDEVYLFSADPAGNLTGYFHGFDFEAALNGKTFGRYVTSIGEEHFVEQSSASLGAMNSGPRIGPVVISEIMYRPPDVFTNGAYWNNSEDEYIELRNITSSAVPLYDTAYPTNTWKLDRAVEFHFPTNTTIPANACLLVVNFDPVAQPAQLAAFRAKYGVSTSIPIFGPYRGDLGNSGENVSLYLPDGPVQSGPDLGVVPYVLVDRVRYSDQSPWPVAADGIGQALHRRSLSSYGDDPVNWTTARPTPGGWYVGGTSPTIDQQPVNQTALATTTAIFTIGATGPGPLTYQWRFNGANLAGATNSMLVLTNVQLSQSGDYQVVVLNTNGAASSDIATLSVVVALTILEQPEDAISRDGSNVTFSVVATTHNPPLDYQWRFNGTAIQGATESMLLLTNVQTSNAGTYSVTVTDSVGPIESANATLRVVVAPAVIEPLPPLHLTAVSGQNITLHARTKGALPMQYRWYQFQTNHSFALLMNQVLNTNTAVLAITNVSSAVDQACYALVLTNEACPIATSAFTNWYLTVLADNDADGMPDDWENQFHFNPNDPSDATNDFDLDGMLNRSEYIAGTDPTGPTSYLKVERILASNTVALEFFAVSNRSYTVEYKDNFGDPSWTRVADVPALATNRLESITDVAPTTNRFYRLFTPRGP